MVWIADAETNQVIPAHSIDEVELKSSNGNPRDLREAYLLFNTRVYLIDVVSNANEAATKGTVYQVLAGVSDRDL